MATETPSNSEDHLHDNTKIDVSIATDGSTVSDSTINVEDVTGRDKIVKGDNVGGDKVEGDKVVINVQVTQNVLAPDNTQTPQKSVPAKILPPLPPAFVPRPKELEQLRNAILNSGPSGRVVLTALTGMGGIGKTALATAVCKDQEIQNFFHDGIIWFDIGQHPNDKVTLLREIGKLIGDPLVFYESEVSAINRLRIELPKRAILLVLDDVWNFEHVKCFLIEAPTCRTLVTTRNSSIAQQLEAIEVKLNVMTEEQAIQLLQNLVGSEHPLFSQVAKRLGYLPLALKLVGAYLKRGNINRWLETYHNPGEIRLGPGSTQRENNLQVCFDISFQELQKEEQQLYEMFGIFREDLWIPLHVVERLWKNLISPQTQIPIERIVNDLIDLALVESNEQNEIKLHDLLHNYTIERLGDKLPRIHSDFLFSYNPSNESWHKIKDDGYIYDELLHHLTEAKRTREIAELILTLPNWFGIDRDQEHNYSIERLIINSWKAYLQENSDHARKLLRTWLGEKNFYIFRNPPNLRTKLVAVKCAFEVDDNIVIAYALQNTDVQVRSSAIVFTYFRYLQNKEAGFQVYSLQADNTRWHHIPNPQAIRTFIDLACILLSCEYRDKNSITNYSLRIAGLALSTVKQATFIDNKLLRLVSGIARQFILNTLITILSNILNVGSVSRSEHRSSIISLGEMEVFFQHVHTNHSPIKVLLPYFNRDKGDLLSITDKIVAVYDRSNYGNFDTHAPMFICGYLLVSHGVHNPSRILEVLNAIFTLKQSEWQKERQINIMAVWRAILIRQQFIEEVWLNQFRFFLIEYMSNINHDFGLGHTAAGSYQYFPITWYAEIWNRVYPDQHVDLITKYLGQAEETQNKALTLHILKGLSDSRGNFVNYLPILEQLHPYLLLADIAIKELAIGVVARFRSRQREVVDFWLKNSDISKHREVLNKVQEFSYGDSHNDIYLEVGNIGNVIIGLLAYAPPSNLSWLINQFEEVLYQPNLRKGLYFFFNVILDTLEADEQKILQIFEM